MYTSKSSKNSLTLTLLILTGIVLGSFIGFYLGKFPFLSWLDYGKEFGIGGPGFIELAVLKLSFSLLFRINVAGVIGVAIGIFVYSRL